ncbi:hypothetical protein C8F01DRAFT_1281344 [Mycena amicta]|nr:hypothetical protein C8F01DRAFT_1281344 [Mycena amicta]
MFQIDHQRSSEVVNMRLDPASDVNCGSPRKSEAMGVLTLHVDTIPRIAVRLFFLRRAVEASALLALAIKLALNSTPEIKCRKIADSASRVADDVLKDLRKLWQTEERVDGGKARNAVDYYRRLASRDIWAVILSEFRCLRGIEFKMPKYTSLTLKLEAGLEANLEVSSWKRTRSHHPNSSPAGNRFRDTSVQPHSDANLRLTAASTSSWMPASPRQFAG